MTNARFKILDNIYRNRAIEVLRVSRESASDTTIIVKRLNLATSTYRDAARLRYESRVLAELANARNVIRGGELYEDGRDLGLFIEDIHGHSLAQLVSSNHKFTALEVANIACDILAALVDIHAKKIVHKDVTPNNIIYNPQTHAVRLADFGISSRAAREHQHVESLSAIEGTLAYIPPEQTGRVNRPVDARSDIYSLGATLYHVMSGKTPFAHEGLAQLVYDILANEPVSLRSAAPQYPAIMVNLIAVMMRKAPEDRYQSTQGLLFDWERVRDALQRSESAPSFALRERDRNEDFQIPQKLYGREQDVARLVAAYEQTREGAATLLMVGGPSGIGKSALVGELHRNLVQHNGLFISGKCDQLRRHVPFNALSLAISGWVRRVLAESDGEIQRVRAVTQNALGHVGQALLEVVPDLELLVGAQKPIPKLGVQENENRLLMVLRRFVHSLALETPLVLFLDDLQWADSGTLKLWKTLATDPTPAGRLMLVGAYRSNEVSPAHPLMMALGEVADTRAFDTLDVTPLDAATVTQMVQEATRASMDDARNLTRIVMTKTQGNPFFIREFLKHLEEKGLLLFNSARDTWTWQTQEVLAANVTDNVVVLMSAKLKQLGTSEQNLLSLAACLGATFKVSQIQLVSEVDRADVLAQLHATSRMGFISPITQSHRYARDTGDEVVYKFAHDRIQQAAYELMNEDVRIATHYKIGQRFLTLHQDTPAEKWVFDVVDHLNKSTRLIQNQGERKRLATLNVVAGREAMKSAVYSVALVHFGTSRELMGESAWQDDYEIMRDLDMALAECEWLSNKGQEAEQRLRDLLPRLRTGIEKARLQKMRCAVLTAQGKLADAIDAGLGGLRALGIRLPSQPKFPSVVKALVQVQLSLRGKDIDALPNAPELTDERLLMAQQTLQSLVIPTYTTRPMLNAVVLLTMAHITIKHGNSTVSACAYVALAIVFSQLNNYKNAVGFARIARVYLDKIEDSISAGSTLTISYAWCFPEHSLKYMYREHEKAYALGMEEGDPNSAHWAVVFGMTPLAIASLDEFVENDAQRASAMALVTERQQISDSLTLRQVYYCLAGKTESPYTMSDATHDEAAVEALAVETGGSARCEFYGANVTALCIHRDFDRALKNIGIAHDYKVYETLTDMSAALFAFFTAITLTQRRLTKGTGSIEKAAYLRKAVGKLKAVAAFAPQNFGGALKIVQAELAAIQGDHTKALAHYEEGLRLLERSDYLCFYATALECAGRHMMRLGLKRVGLVQLNEAHQTFRRWGAHAKVKLLDSEFGTEWASRAATSISPTTATTVGTSITATSTGDIGARLDLARITEVSQALSQEVEQEKLTQMIITNLAMAAGATRAALILEENGDLRVYSAKGDEQGAPLALVKYAYRAKETVLIDDVREDTRFRDDPYLSKEAPASLLCLPLMRQGQVRGLIYLENRLSTKAFDAKHVRMVNIVASQAAISLENSRLYKDMETALAHRTAELKAANERVLEITKESVEVQMAGGFAHEIRNSLSGPQYVLTGNGPGETPADLLQAAVEQVRKAAADRVKSGDPLDEALENLLTESNFMRDTYQLLGAGITRGLNIATTILDYAQVGHLRLGESVVDLKQIVDDVLDSVNTDLEKHAIRVENLLQEGLQSRVSETHLHSIVRNIVHNACDAMGAVDRPEGRCLRITGSVEDGSIKIAVDDNGIGMSTDVKERIFQPFFSTKGAAGTGLGLGMARKLVNVYGGSISFSSEEQKGTTFQVVLPAVKTRGERRSNDGLN